MTTNTESDRPVVRRLTDRRRITLAVLAERDAESYTLRTSRSIGRATGTDPAGAASCLKGMARLGLVVKIQDGVHLVSWQITDRGRAALKGGIWRP